MMRLIDIMIIFSPTHIQNVIQNVIILLYRMLFVIQNVIYLFRITLRSEYYKFIVCFRLCCVRVCVVKKKEKKIIIQESHFLASYKVSH